MLFHTASPLEVRETAKLAISINELLENLGKVSIALINGFALGGGLELAESCMLRVAVASARLGHPEVRLGVVAGWGGTTRLPRLIGKGRAAELLLTGGMVTAQKALEMGLVNLVTEKDELQPEGERLMDMLRSHIDIDEASQDAVDTDGVAHFLASYDGNEVSTDTGHVLFRTA